MFNWMYLTTEDASSMTPIETAAALHGIATNEAYSLKDRLRAALQALDFYEAERANQRLYVTMIQDRTGVDPIPYVFSTPEKAITFARTKAAEYVREGQTVEEHEVSGWLSCATYGTEDDCVWVIERDLNGTKPPT